MSWQRLPFSRDCWSLLTAVQNLSWAFQPELSVQGLCIRRGLPHSMKSGIEEPGGSCLFLHSWPSLGSHIALRLYWMMTDTGICPISKGRDIDTTSWWGVTRLRCKRSVWTERYFHGHQQKTHYAQRIAKRWKRKRKRITWKGKYFWNRLHELTFFLNQIYIL